MISPPPSIPSPPPVVIDVDDKQMNIYFSECNSISLQEFTVLNFQSPNSFSDVDILKSLLIYLHLYRPAYYGLNNVSVHRTYQWWIQEFQNRVGGGGLVLAQ